MVETRHPSEWLEGWPVKEPEFPLNGGWMMDHLFWALWYNGCDEQVEKLADMMRDASGQVTRSDTSFDDDGVELLWMMLVQYFGDYGTSPRSGWVSDTSGAAEFLDAHIERTWGRCDNG